MRENAGASAEEAAESVARERARRIADAVKRVIDRPNYGPTTADRLYRYAVRHLLVAEAEAGSAQIPPMYTIAVADALGRAQSPTAEGWETRAAELAAASCLYFAAADVADDVADGDTRISLGVDVNDACRLLFLYQEALLALDVAVESRITLLQNFAACGMLMAGGQELDLVGTDAPHASKPLEISVGKTGSEFAACIAAPAVALGIESAPYFKFGFALGGLLQIGSDYFDLFLDPQSDDWEAAKPTLPIRHGLAHRRHGPEVSMLLAGDRQRLDRKPAGLWRLVQAGAGPKLDEIRATLAGDMREAGEQTDCAALLAEFRDELDGMAREVVEALAEYKDDPAPATGDPERERATCVKRARAFLDRDPAFEEAVDLHHDAIEGVDIARGAFFGPAFATVRWPAAEFARAQALDAADGRYFSGQTGAALDPVCAGLALQLGAKPTRALLKCCRTAGTTGDPGIAAQAMLGVLAARGGGGRSTFAGELAQAARALAEIADLESVFTDVARDALLVQALSEFRSDAVVATALDGVFGRLRARRRLSGSFGNVLETALAGTALRGEDGLRPETVRALVDAQDPDGGYAACDLLRPLPDITDRMYASRTVTTAVVLSCIQQE